MTGYVQGTRELAYRAHAGQLDNAGRPYIEHLARVAAAVSDDPEAEAAAWLCDVMEDCPAYEDDLWELALPISVRTALFLLSRQGTALDIYYRGIKTNRIALRVKLAKIADNANEERLALRDVDARCGTAAVGVRGGNQNAYRRLTGRGGD